MVVRFNTREIVFESAQFSGGGSNVTIAGTKALTDDGVDNLSVDGRVNLSLLNAIPAISTTDTFFAGFANVAIRIAGVNRTSRLTGTAVLENASLATFVGSDRLSSTGFRDAFCSRPIRFRSIRQLGIWGAAGLSQAAVHCSTTT